MKLALMDLTISILQGHDKIKCPIEFLQFQELSFTATQNWLNQYIESELFKMVMHRYPAWIE